MTTTISVLCHDLCETHTATKQSTPINGVSLLHARAPALDVLLGKARHSKRRSVQVCMCMHYLTI